MSPRSRERLQLAVDLFQRDRPVLLGIALAEHAVVDAVQHQELFHDDSNLVSIDVDDFSGLGRFDDRVGDAQILQAVAATDYRCGIAADYSGEMLDLQRERVGALERNGFFLEGLVPRMVFFLFVILEAHGRNA